MVALHKKERQAMELQGFALKVSIQVSHCMLGCCRGQICSGPNGQSNFNIQVLHVPVQVPVRAACWLCSWGSSPGAW